MSKGTTNRRLSCPLLVLLSPLLLPLPPPIRMVCLTMQPFEPRVLLRALSVAMALSIACICLRCLMWLTMTIPNWNTWMARPWRMAGISSSTTTGVSPCALSIVRGTAWCSALAHVHHITRTTQHTPHNNVWCVVVCTCMYLCRYNVQSFRFVCIMCSSCTHGTCVV